MLAPEPKGSGGINWKRAVYQDICDASGELTQKDIVGTGEGSNARRTAHGWLEKNGVVRTDKLHGPNGERRAERYLPMLDLDVDVLATMPNLNELAAPGASSGVVNNEASNEAADL